MRPLPSLTGVLGLSLSMKARTLRSAAQPIAAEFVKGHNAFKNLKLDETMEGEVISTMQGSAPMTGRLHGISRIYTTSASELR